MPILATLLAAVTGALVLTAGATAMATPRPPGCDAVVYDAVGTIPAQEVPELESAIQATQASLQFRIIRSVPSGDLDAYEKRLETGCGWASATGARPPLMALVVIDLDDQLVGFYPGSSVAKAIPPALWSQEMDELTAIFSTGNVHDDVFGAADDLNAVLKAAPYIDPNAKLDSATPPPPAYAIGRGEPQADVIPATRRSGAPSKVLVIGVLAVLAAALRLSHRMRRPQTDPKAPRSYGRGGSTGF